LKRKQAVLEEDLVAAIATSNGIAHWKPGNYVSSIDALRTAVDLYATLSHSDRKHFVNSADAWVLYAIVHLEMLRDSKIPKDPSWVGKLESAINEASRCFAQYEATSPHNIGTHYRGRYWGLLAFWEMYKLDRDATVMAGAWSHAYDMCGLAIGEGEPAGRKAFGIMAGKYCAACVGLHKYTKAELTADTKKQVLLETARLVSDLGADYVALFGDTKVLRTWSKILSLYVKVGEELTRQSLELLPPFFEACDCQDGIQLFTPIH
jgi:hypothetical protein